MPNSYSQFCRIIAEYLSQNFSSCRLFHIGSVSRFIKISHYCLFYITPGIRFLINSRCNFTQPWWVFPLWRIPLCFRFIGLHGFLSRNSPRIKFSTVIIATFTDDNNYTRIRISSSFVQWNIQGIVISTSTWRLAISHRFSISEISICIRICDLVINAGTSDDWIMKFPSETLKHWSQKSKESLWHTVECRSFYIFYEKLSNSLRI